MDKTIPLKRLEVRLDNPTIRVDTYEDVQSSKFVTGRIVLMNQEPLPIRNVKVWLRVERKVSWFIKSFSYQLVKNIDNILLKEVTLYPPSPHVKPANRLEPGNHVWQFCFELETPIAESIHGLHHAHLRYIIEAEVLMRGLLSPTLRASQTLHVINPSSTQVRNSSSEHQKKSSVGTKGVEYIIYAPSVRHRWGEPVDFEFRVPRSPNVGRISAIFKLREEIKLQALFNKRLISDTRESFIAEGEKDLTSESTATQVRFPLPRSLTVCRQSVKEERIQINHSIRITLEIEDDYGKVERVEFDFPFHLEFPVGIKFDEKGSACFDGVRKIPTGEEEGLLDAPPPFGKHDQDQLYAQDSMPTYLTSTDVDHQAIQNPERSSGELRINSPSEITPSYELAVQGPELYFMSGNSLPTYDNISGGLEQRGHIEYPSPAVCHRVRSH
ncbi:hypothetical protein LTR84_005705 [Exophiala bonariae]|uniref:Arrestin-like N-terminal domain-containing protein n=1 Tax=Exophiala bonariae TaxID=1690606 RepID=A0AAV9N3H0_9EURO|nr:hypothetical protein LTR84_005705 [Exophiala bonariae]